MCRTAWARQGQRWWRLQHAARPAHLASICWVLQDQQQQGRQGPHMACCYRHRFIAEQGCGKQRAETKHKRCGWPDYLPVAMLHDLIRSSYIRSQVEHSGHLCHTD